MSILGLIKKPGEIDEINGGPEGDQNQVVFSTQAHHGEKAPEGKSRKSEP